ncbi:hypothetical protein ONA91_38210 [Micromonospora sp. DR5-3]|uniref:hypothetical protein n=1 Tax=unclassified Micromonospora TaxID=2617518 RepID=UPI001651FBAC|nr:MULTISPECIES: hypothetical protein [unclassified Micromonospora]MCW3820280.1 hypothetical protein [Micromonospora sp. DR5-3]
MAKSDPAAREHGARRLTGIRPCSREEALEWAAKFAVACRCAQEVREIMFDPLV